MITRFDLFGWTDSSVDDIAFQVQQILSIEFRLHNSYFVGGDYYAWRDGDISELTLQENYVDEEGYFTEDAYQSFSTLLYASGFDTESLTRIGSLPGAVLLRSTTA